MKMKQLPNGIWVPDDSNAMKERIEDFDPISADELRENMILPINAALAKGMPPEQPAAIPLEAVARMCRTIMMMGNSLAVTEHTLSTIVNDETIPEDIRSKIQSLLGPKVERSSFFDEEPTKDMPNEEQND